MNFNELLHRQVKQVPQATVVAACRPSSLDVLIRNLIRQAAENNAAELNRTFLRPGQREVRDE